MSRESPVPKHLIRVERRLAEKAAYLDKLCKTTASGISRALDVLMARRTAEEGR